LKTDNEQNKKKTRYTQDEVSDMGHEVLVGDCKIFDDMSSINNYEKKISQPSGDDRGSNGKFAIHELDH